MLLAAWWENITVQVSQVTTLIQVQICVIFQQYWYMIDIYDCAVVSRKWFLMHWLESHIFVLLLCWIDSFSCYNPVYKNFLLYTTDLLRIDNVSRGKHKGKVAVPCVKGLSEAFARILKSRGISRRSPHRHILTKRYGTLWFIRRTRSRMRRRPNWSTVSLARTAPAHTLRRQAGRLVWGSRSTRKKRTLSQLVHRPEPPEQRRIV